MEQQKKHRKVLRAAVTRGANDLEQSLVAEVVQDREIQVSWELLQYKFDELKMIDKEIYAGLLNEDASEQDLLNEMDACDKYMKRCTDLRFRCNNLLDEKITNDSLTGRRKFKLPTIEFKKFDGNIRDWLSFWSQFKKVHEDPDIDADDKIQYLIQATVPCSRARKLVESFPAMGKNYEKIIDSMKSRFGREDLQIEVYVRELLKMILGNATSQSKMELSLLYDNIETQLRALETLGITSDKCSAMLFPLIESCLPQDILRVWQRSSFNECSTVESKDTGNAKESTLESRLQSLMKFLKHEVENEQHISLASEGFGFHSCPSIYVENSGQKKKLAKSVSTVPTATGLMNYDVVKCLFCGGTHGSETCFKAHKFTLEQKKHILTEKKACFRCLKTGHQSRRCRVNLKCVVCSKPHVTLICPELPGHKQSDKNVDVKAEADNKDQALTNHTSTPVFLQTLRVKISSEAGTREIRALIDSGSQRSYVLKSTASQLGCKPKRREKVIHCLFGGTEAEYNHSCYDITLSKENYSCTFEALDQFMICNDVIPVFNGPWIEELRSLNIQLHDVGDPGPIEVLIGADVLGKMYTGERHILKCGLVAIQTQLGWTLMGKVPYISNTNTTMSVLSLLTKDASISYLWELDVLGIVDPAEKKSREEMAVAAMELFLETINIVEDGRYEVRLPWLEGHPPLPNNYAITKKRLNATIQKLTTVQLQEYDWVFKEWLAEGIIEEIGEQHACDRGHYLPHRPVIKENSTTRIRPVFDASARERNNPSLNCCLEKGPNLIELIPSILLRFRELKFGVVSDIRKAFLQISIHEADRDVLRFLWIDSDGNTKIYRHKRVVFGVNSSPFLLGATIEHHLSQSLMKCESPDKVYSSDTILRLARSFYVDNCVTSVPDEDTLKRFIRESRMVMAEAKFDLRGWEFTEDTRDPLAVVPVLGLIWCPRKDILRINKDCLKDVSSVEVVTKRLILSLAQRVFDPIGFTCPATLIPKLLLQQVWKKRLPWDTPVDDDIAHVFCDWLKGLPYLLRIEIPRWICAGFEEGQQQSLHIFCDASKNSFAAVIFLRVVQNGKAYVHLLAAKARIAPLKQMTIPRLELMAATIGARLYSNVVKNIENKIESFFWSDSSTILSWIRRNEQWATFVWNRVAEIRKLTPVEAWRHIPGALNPADCPSRGCSPKQLLQSKWWEGPQWLYEEPRMWPSENLVCDEEEIGTERKKKSLVKTLLNNCKSVDWHLTYFSKYSKIVRMIAWIFRFKHNAKYSDKKCTGELTVEEIDMAERFLLTVIQQESLLEDKQLRPLHPFRDDFGLLRLQSRVSRREDNNSFRFPVVLPAKHPVVDRLIYGLHVKSCHVGTQGLLCILREKYWVLGGRRAVRSVISKCVICKRHNAKPFTVESPPLPLDRVRDAIAFEVTGVDFAGPLYLKNGEKAWICLFTCAVYRAVHLELTNSLSTSNFIQVMRRFVARRGRPKTIYSDNGTNFAGTENAFKQLDWTVIAQNSSVDRIAWRFNPPSAPWWGGFWERLIGMLKQLLRKVLGRASLNYEDLLTLLCDCEAIINARPLTYMSDVSNDLVALTPAMFLRDLIESDTPDCDAVDKKSLCRKMRHKQKLREDLRRRFRNEYLGQLKSVCSKKSGRQISLGEIVLIGNDKEKRLDWPLGRVIEVLPGRDNQIRLVRVDTARGQLLRPVQRIYPLECVDYTEGTIMSTKMESDRQCEKIPKHPVVENESIGVPDVKIQNREAIVTRSGRVSRVTKRF